MAENKLGGNVIRLQPKGEDYTLYYAHLEEKLVAQGSRVEKGDTHGLAGNPGNARSTPTHLNLGIYAYGGAINPLPFINPFVK